MIYANKTSKFAKKILSNCLILQFSATQTILFCIFCNYKLHKKEAPEVLARVLDDYSFLYLPSPICSILWLVRQRLRTMQIALFLTD